MNILLIGTVEVDRVFVGRALSDKPAVGYPS